METKAEISYVGASQEASEIASKLPEVGRFPTVFRGSMVLKAP